MKPTLFLASLLLSTAMCAVNLTGTIKTDTQAPVVGAVVSDGYSVVTTNSDGAYTMPYNPSAAFVFVSVPSGYDFPTDSTGSPKIWQAIDTTATSHNHDFKLHRQEDGGRADSTHVLIVMGDPQVIDAYGLWRFRNETMADIQQLQSTYPSGTKFVGLVVGDLVWDSYKNFLDQKSNLESAGFPTFVAIGNHDHNRNVVQQPTQQEQDSMASMEFEKYFGPTYYSFNCGAIHYIVLDNVYYRGYKGGDKKYDCSLTKKQLAWVKQDIATLHEGTQVVFAMHINSSEMMAQRDSLRKWINPLNTTNYLMSGHVHTSETSVMSKNTTKQLSSLIEHNIAACQGSYWCSDWCADGAPNGYKVFETNQQGICNWFYKGTGLDRDFRIRTYPRGSINAGNSKSKAVLANVWDYDKECSVKILVDGKQTNMKQFDGTDPAIYDLMLDEGDTRPNYPGSEGGTEADRNPGSKKTSHLFYYTPDASENNAQFEVVFTDRFGKVTTAPILRHMMVASFQKTDEKWVYTQDFNGLPSYPNYSPRGIWVAGHTPEGWYASYDSDTIGYNYLRVNHGTNTTGWIYSFGNADASAPSDPSKNSRERSLGSLTTDKQKCISYGVLIENNTNATINALDINYTGEVWRIGSDTKTQESLQFSYVILTDDEAQGIRDRTKWIGQMRTTAASQLNFTTPSTLTPSKANTAIDGNNINNRSEVKGTIELNWEPGSVILLRWDDQRSNATSDQGLAIDDVQIVAHTQSTGLQQQTMQQIPWGTHTYMLNGHIFIQSTSETYTIMGHPIR